MSDSSPSPLPISVEEEDETRPVCAGCGAEEADIWADGGWFCVGCLTCPICGDIDCLEDTHG